MSRMKRTPGGKKYSTHTFLYILRPR